MLDNAHLMRLAARFARPVRAWGADNGPTWPPVPPPGHPARPSRRIALPEPNFWRFLEPQGASWWHRYQLTGLPARSGSSGASGFGVADTPPRCHGRDLLLADGTALEWAPGMLAARAVR